MTQLLTMSPISKTFGGTRALNNVAISIGRGEIVGLIGRNGCGKSTLIKHLSGYHAPDEPGWIDIAGRRARLPVKPDEARKLGLSFVHQDLGLLREASILDNLRVGRFATTPFGNIRWRSERQAAREALEAFDLNVDPLTPLSELSNVERAIVALVRSFMELQGVDGGVLVLDEPTAFLAQDDVGTLFRAMRALADRGVGLLLVSHRLDEVLEITDRVLVMRDGELIADVTTSETNEDELVSILLGRALGTYYPEKRSEPIAGSPVLEVAGLTTPGLHDVSLTVRRGEIVGLTGLRAMGFERVPHALFGAATDVRGTITVDGSSFSAASLTPTAAMQAGIGMLPADRKRASGAQAFTVRENISLTKIASYAKRSKLNKQAEANDAARLVNEFGVKTGSIESTLSDLSGGNQQKALLAKWFQLQPKVLILHEPTAGVDIGAKQDIFSHITRLAASGTAVVLVSEEFADLAALCDRVLTFHDGIVHPNELAGTSLDEGAILAQCYRGISNTDESSSEHVQTGNGIEAQS